MAYQVLARKWRPQRFDDVIGQRGVTQTLRNAITAKRIAQSFVFSGPRGVGKTTTARILARALNCDKGPTPDPCGTCDACIEIAQGRDMDVLEIDAATNTQVEKVRDVIITGLAVAPVRDRYKIFIIDEVHRLSPNSFDALLKSIEEPPPHVVFMMATTELDKVPATIQSRSQVFELKTIGNRQIADQLRKIADAERLQVDEAALALIAQAGDGSMRDAQSAFDQVLAFSGETVTAEDVATVLGLVQRDLLFEIVSVVAREDAPGVFELARRAVEAGYDLRTVIRELGRLTRDLLVVTIDPSRAADPEIAAESERQTIVDLARQFSPEDLMRAFDVFTKAEYDIRGSLQPRYHLEMALLRWIHLRRLVPLADLIQQVGGGASAQPRPAAARPAPPVRPAAGPAAAPGPPKPAAPPVGPKAATAGGGGKPTSAAGGGRAPASNGDAAPDFQPVEPAQLKDAFLGAVRQAKKFFFGTVVAQAQRIDVTPERIVFVFAPQHRALRTQFEQTRPWLEVAAAQLAGHKVAVMASEGTASPGAPNPAPVGEGGTPGPAEAGGPDRREELKQQALADSGVQALLDVFAAEIKDVEELK